MRALDLIDLAGDPYARGRELGAARSRRIQAYLADWMASLATAGVNDPKSYLEGMLRVTGFASSVRDHTPDLLEEVRGMAEGAGQPYEWLLAAQCLDEEWAYRASPSVSREGLQKCSSVALRGPDDTVLIGQNMDLGGYTDGHQILYRLASRESEPGALIFSVSGMIALFGVNTRRIGVCVNSLPQLPAARHGLPVAFMVRKLLQANTLRDAVETLRTVPHATGQHYLIADPHEIRSFEASPAGVVEIHSADPGGALHTNHPLAEPRADSPDDWLNSKARLRCLRARLNIGNVDLQAIEAALSSQDDPDYPVSRTAPSSNEPQSAAAITAFTTGSMICRLDWKSDGIDAWVSPGPPSIYGYTHVRL